MRTYLTGLKIMDALQTWSEGEIAWKLWNESWKGTWVSYFPDMIM